MTTVLNDKIITTKFSVRSPPRTTSFKEAYIIHALNILLSILVHNMLIQHLFNYIIVGMLMPGDTNLFTNDTNYSDYDNMLSILSSTSSPWKIKLFIILYNIALLTQIGYWINGFTSIRREKYENICEVQVLPWGIQITEYTKIGDVSKDHQIKRCPYPTIMNKKSKFIPMENVVDVIISEVVLSYKVRNCIMFRIKYCRDEQDGKSYGANKMGNENVTLVSAFSTTMVEMSYIECTQIWQGITNALSKYQ